jgi:chemotaxis response regulator CheB
MPKTVLVVDDNAYIRQALCKVFTSEADFDICGEAATDGKRSQRLTSFSLI